MQVGSCHYIYFSGGCLLLTLLFFSPVDTIDFVAVNALLSFDVCDTRSCVNITITNDNVEEFFSYSLTRTVNLNARIELNPANGKISIVDNDGNNVAV